MARHSLTRRQGAVRSRAGFQRRYTHAVGTTRTLVLLPGMDGSDRLFEPLRRAVSPDVETIAIAYPPGGSEWL